MFLVFCQTLFRVAVTPNPCQDQNTRKLFCIPFSNKGQFLLPHGTFLFRKPVETKATLLANSNKQGVLIVELELTSGFKDALLKYLRAKLKAELEACKLDVNRLVHFTPAFHLASMDNVIGYVVPWNILQQMQLVNNGFSFISKSIYSKSSSSKV